MPTERPALQISASASTFAGATSRQRPQQLDNPRIGVDGKSEFLPNGVDDVRDASVAVSGVHVFGFDDADDGVDGGVVVVVVTTYPKFQSI